MSGVKRSFHLTAYEYDLAQQIAESNGASVNFVIRIALRKLAGLPVPPFRIPAESLGDQVGERVTSL